jgi:hypothetical protein
VADLASAVAVLRHSPLFSADNIADYLHVAWDEGDVYLLAWPGPGTRPLTESFLARYRYNPSHSALPVLAASTAGLMGSPPGQGPVLAATPLIPGRATKMVKLSKLYERARMIYEANKGKPYPIRRDPTLPPVEGWQ